MPEIPPKQQSRLIVRHKELALLVQVNSGGNINLAWLFQGQFILYIRKYVCFSFTSKKVTETSGQRCEKALTLSHPISLEVPNQPQPAAAVLAVVAADAAIVQVHVPTEFGVVLNTRPIVRRS